MNETAVNELDAGSWTLDTAASSIGFSADAMFGMKVKGQFSRFEATLMAGLSAADSSISVTVWTDSVATGNKTRDGHLRSGNVFASAKFPTLEFRSTAITETSGGIDVTGNLRVRDITKPVTFHALRSAEPGPPRYTAELIAAPKEFGVTRLGATKPVKVLLDATLKRA